MDKIIGLKKIVYELATEYLGSEKTMVSVGFKKITGSEILASAGKVMVMPKSSRVKGIPVGKIVKAFEEKGFQMSGADGAPVPPTPPTIPIKPPAPPTAQYNLPSAKPERAEALKSYLTRLSQGGSFDTVREDLRKEFHLAEASEIIQAEQQLVEDGVPLEEVQKLCDVHSALFHGATEEERIANAEREITAPMIRTADHKKAGQQAQYGDKNALAVKLIMIPGHPFETLTWENQTSPRRIESFRDVAKLGTSLKDVTHAIHGVTVYYAKKDDLLYPLLKIKYDVTGPSPAIWMMDGEIRNESGCLDKIEIEDNAWKVAAEAVVQRADKMIYKETSILFPICVVSFMEDKWKQTYRDPKDYEDCPGVVNKVYEAAEEDKPTIKEKEVQIMVGMTETKRHNSFFTGEIVVSGGHLKLDQLERLLSTIPMEIISVDIDNINHYLNEDEGQKTFKHPKIALGRKVLSHHLLKVGPLTHQTIRGLRVGRRSGVSIWAERGGKTMLVNYYAVRDAEDNYLGTAEFVWDMEFVKRHF